MLSSGSRDRLILQRDIRTPSIVPERKLTGHKQEVCAFPTLDTTGIMFCLYFFLFARK